MGGPSEQPWVAPRSSPSGEIRGNLVAVPEPTSLALLGLVASGLFARRAIRSRMKEA
jgi:hypothetical protein